MSENKCVLILPYFGEFNNYFSLFLKSCAYNNSYTWMVFTDNEFCYDCPENVLVKKIAFKDVKTIANNKFGFDVALSSPYKLCDFKPAYGFIFEEFISDFEYWGHCDCDLIFGNLEKMISPLLDEGYDKLFAAGHLTIYKNNYENNRRFMKPLNGRMLYKEVFTTDQICVFDEDFNNNDNVHRIFLEDGAKVFEKDLSMNPSILYAKFVRAYYDKNKHDYVNEQYKRARYFWNDGNILRFECDDEKITNKEFAYLHLQMRKMRVKTSLIDNTFEILPDRFVSRKIPRTSNEMNLIWIGFPYMFWIDTFLMRLRRYLKKYKKNNNGK